eukprot:456242-Hanusia_phi.AAC.1
MATGRNALPAAAGQPGPRPLPDPSQRQLHVLQLIIGSCTALRQRQDLGRCEERGLSCWLLGVSCFAPALLWFGASRFNGGVASGESPDTPERVSKIACQ